MPRPVIGISAATERARWGAWDEVATLLPRSYADAVQHAGGLALLLPTDPLGADSPDDVLDRFDALILAGGADLDPRSYGAAPHPEVTVTRPERDEVELALARRALERELALLGICRGMQVLNVATGGTLIQHLPDAASDDRHRPVPGSFAEHGVRLEPGSLASRAAGADRITVKTHHHQGVDDLGEGLVASGWSESDGIVEAIELPGGPFVLGVLWHPEEDPGSRVIPSLVEWLVAAER
jgi:putative glutamine amidotransferase